MYVVVSTTSGFLFYLNRTNEFPPWWKLGRGFYKLLFGFRLLHKNQNQ